jgi:hypothetical protein
MSSPRTDTHLVRVLYQYTPNGDGQIALALSEVREFSVGIAACCLAHWRAFVSAWLCVLEAQLAFDCDVCYCLTH